MNLVTDNIRDLFKTYLLSSLSSAAAISIFGFVDILAIGQGVGADAVAAFSIVQPLFGVTSFLGVFLGVGTSVTMAVTKGRNEYAESNAQFTASLILMSLLTLLVWGFFLYFSEDIYIFFGANDFLMPYVRDYADQFILCLPLFFFSIYLASIIQVDGTPKLTMFSVLFSGLFNVLGDWYLVFVAGMGMKGAALATVISNAIQVVIYVSYFFTKRCNVRVLRPHNWLAAMWWIIQAGFSTGIVDIAYILITILLNNQVLRYGNETDLAIFGVAYTCSCLFQRLFGGTGRAVQPIISANYGAKQQDRIHETFRLAVKTELILGGAFTAVGVLFPMHLTGLFIEVTEEVSRAAPGIIRTYFASFLLMGVSMFAVYHFQSIMRSMLATVIALLRGLIVSGVLVCVFPKFLGLCGIWWAMTLTEIVVAGISAYYFKKTRLWIAEYVKT